jgi:hypothetical protein
MNFDKDIEAFIKDICKELVEENVAIFAGAGLSLPAGFVGWGELLKPIADELGIDIKKEHDLVALAQFHCNENGQNRSQLNKRLIEEFSKEAKITDNHKILSRLPIGIYWTTNYDKLIEESIIDAGKVPDVKYTKDHLASTKPKRDVIVYKMHGDIDHPNNAILTRDDYESYHVKMDQYVTALSGDFVSKTFIFIGFSFTDPNLDYILSRIRVSFTSSPKRHYCFLKKVIIDDGELVADFDYRKRRQELFIGDLRRFNIKAIIVGDYNEITEILREIENRYKKKTIFISGAAHDFGIFGADKAQLFIHNLSKKLIASGYKIVSGFGLGVGSAVISGALEEIYMNPKRSSNNQLLLRPFPQQVFGATVKEELWKRYREDMISYAGTAIFLYGNKLDDGKIIESNGMRQEFDIAKENSLSILPIGTTGFMAEEFWNEIQSSIDDAYHKNKHSEELKKMFNLMGDKTAEPEKLIETILKFLDKLTD